MAHNISKKKSFIGENIKKIRQLKRISQADFATIFDLARPSIGAYEEGRAEPKIDTIIRIANYFRISIDVLLTRKLTTNEIFSLDQIKEKLDKAHKSKEIKGISFNHSSYANISYVSIGDNIDYLINHMSTNYLNRLTMIQFPITSKKALRSFEVNGSEMEYHQQGLHHGDIVVGEIHNGDNFQEFIEHLFVIVTKESIRIRRLKAINKETLLLKSDDPHYEDIFVSTKEILECWIVKAAYTTYLNAPSLLEERVMKLERDIDLLTKKP